MKEEFTTNTRRWYDRDPILSSAMKTLENTDDETQIKIALNLIKIITEHSGKEVSAQAAFCGECGYNFAAGTSPYTVPPQASVMAEDTAPLKVSDYLIMSLLNCIPIAGIVVMLIWAFSSGVNVNRRNFSRAYLIMAAVGVVLYFILLIAMVGFMAARSP